MNNFPEYFIPKNISNFKVYEYKSILGKLRNNIYEHVIKETDMTKRFYDFDKFFKTNKIVDNEIKTILIDDIVTELKNLNWTLAKVFGGLGLIICDNSKNLNSSIWKSHLDFEEL